MAVVLDLKRLRSNLEASEPKKEASDDDLDNPDLGYSEGLKYLIRNVIIPLSRKETINSSDLDFSKFTDMDLSDLYDYYYANHYDGSSAWYKLKALYLHCRKAPTQTAPVQFL